MSKFNHRTDGGDVCRLALVHPYPLVVVHPVDLDAAVAEVATEAKYNMRTCDRLGGGVVVGSVSVASQSFVHPGGLD